MDTQKDEEIIVSDVNDDNIVKAEETEDTQETEDIKSTSSKSEEELSMLKDQLLRSMAENENIRRRAEKQNEETLKFAITKFARDLITAMDNLYRTTDFLKNHNIELTQELNTIVEGIELTQKEFMSAFNKHGLKRILPVRGEKFDYNLHQAIAHVEDNEIESGSIVQVTQAGYVLEERLIRPAMVTVAK